MFQRRRNLLVLFVVASALVAASESSPPNDSRANATPLSSVPFTVEQDVTGATFEPDEAPACGDESDDGSVWFSYVPESDHVLVLDSFGSSGDVDIAVFRDASGPIDCDDHGYALGSEDARLHVDVVGGERYLIQASSYESDLLVLSGRTYEPFTLTTIIQARGHEDAGNALVRIATRCNEPSVTESLTVEATQGVAPVGASGAADWLLYCMPEEARPTDGLPVVGESGASVTVRPTTGEFRSGPVSADVAGVACNASPRYRECVDLRSSGVQILRPFGVTQS